MTSGPWESRESYDRIVKDAFEFLVSEYGYTAEPTVFPDRWDKPKSTVFRKGRFRIEFQNGVDSIYINDLLFLPGDYEPYGALEDSIVFVDYRRYSIHRVLQSRAAQSLPADDESFATIVQAMSDACRDHAKDIVRGDFSFFGQNAFLVEQVEKHDALRRCVRAIFSSQESAESFSREALGRMPAQADVRFEISLRELDFQS